MKCLSTDQHVHRADTKLATPWLKRTILFSVEQIPTKKQVGKEDKIQS